MDAADYREARQTRRRPAARPPYPGSSARERCAAVRALRTEGYKVDEVTEHHWLINDILHVWPTLSRTLDAATGKRGHPKDLIAAIRTRLPRPYYPTGAGRDEG